MLHTSNDIAAILEMIDALLLGRATVTLDVTGCQKEITLAIVNNRVYHFMEFNCKKCMPN